MNCDEFGKSAPLYFYGELPPEEEERLEDHLDGCERCRAELERVRALAAALDRREAEVPENLLDRCRHDLLATVRAGVARDTAPAPEPRLSIGERVSALLSALWSLRQPIGAVALLAIGYFSAPYIRPAVKSAVADGTATADPVVARVRSVQPDASGRVQISLDEVRKRVISGRLDDGNIQRLLLAASRDENNPGLRVESVDILKDHAASAEVRASLLNSVAHDPNAGVRLKALEGLKGLSAEAEVRKVLAQVLLKDDNPAVRIQAIDMLTASRDDSMVGVLQNLVGREDNSYVRWRCEKALKDMNASVGTF
jgi:HEAT repeats/Putative zinc-finger